MDDVLLHLFEDLKSKVKFECVILVPRSAENPCPQVSKITRHCGITVSIKVYPEDAKRRRCRAMCYTSETTEGKRGLFYSHQCHRSPSSLSLTDNFSLSRFDSITPAMSMFHANAWGLPHAAVMNGSGWCCRIWGPKKRKRIGR